MLDKFKQKIRRIKQKSRNLYLFMRIELLLWLSHKPYLRDTLVVVTGADSTHYKSLCQFLTSLYVYERGIKVVVFDLGLLKTQSQHIKNTFPEAELRLFDYSQYPDYFNIKVNKGEYAWKPVILYDILNEFKCCVCWMDAGNVVTEPLLRLRKITKAIGMYSPRSSECISDWTHPKTIKFLNVFKDLYSKHNLNGACVAVYYHNPKARDLINQWKKCAMIRECIAPIGSNKKNHRQDQAVLSVLAHQSGITKNMPTDRFEFKIHQDIK